MSDQAESSLEQQDVENLEATDGSLWISPCLIRSSRDSHAHYFWLSVTGWSSDVFIVAMTMVTIVRQSISAVEAGSLLLGSKPDDRRFGPAHHLFSVVPLTEEVHRRRGHKQACMCQ